MKDLFLIVGAASRNQLRWAKEHLYYLLVLAPLVLGFAVVTVDQGVAEIPSLRPGPVVFQSVTVLFFLALIAAGLSPAAAEVYHVRSPESAFESFPIGRVTHLLMALAMRSARASVIVLLILAARWRWSGLPLTLVDLAASLLLAGIIALTEVICGLAWIHWSHFYHRFAAIAAVVCAWITSGFGSDLLGKLFLPELFAARRLPLFTEIELLWMLLLLFAAWLLHRRWRHRDIEFALRLGHRRGSTWRFDEIFGDRLGRVILAELQRDFALVGRIFSSAVYVTVALLLLVALLLVTVLWSGMLPQMQNPYGWLGGAWLPPVLAVKAACVVGCLAVIALVPVLVSYQLPHLWLERSVGVRAEDLWTGKLYFTRCITFPVPILIWMVGVANGAPPPSYLLPLLLECLWIWWMLTTIVGSLAFEIPDRPGLALLLMILLGFGIGLLIAWLWPVGIAAYVFGATRGLRDRGIARANYCLVVGES